METIKDCTCDSRGVILVGNKIDMESSRQIPSKDGINLAKKYNIPFFECSAKKGINLDSIFEEAAKIHIENFTKILTRPNTSININKKTEEKKCCS